MNEKSASSKNGILEGKIGKQFLLYFFPLLLGTLFQQLYNMVDTVVVGNFIGKEALAAVGGTTGTLIGLLVGLFVGISSGASVVIAQFYGAKNIANLHKAVHTSMAVALIGGIFLTIFGVVLGPTILQWMDTPEDILEPATAYLQIFFLGTASSFIYNIGSGILRAVGDSKRPLYFLIAACLTNLVLDLLFVIVFKMGIEGVAIATVIAQTLSALLVVITLCRTEDIYHYYPKETKIHGKTLFQIVRIGIPAAVQTMLFSFSNIFIQSAVHTFGTDIVASWTAYAKVDALFWAINAAFGITVTTFIGQNFGARKDDRIRKIVRTSLIMGYSISIFMGVLMWGVGYHLVKLFTDDMQVIEISTRLIKQLMPFYFTFIGVEILSSIIRGMGEAIMPMILTLLGICGLRLMWIFFIAPQFEEFIMTVICYPLSWGFTSILIMIYYLRKRWYIKALNKRDERLSLKEETK